MNNQTLTSEGFQVEGLDAAAMAAFDAGVPQHQSMFPESQSGEDLYFSGEENCLPSAEAMAGYPTSREGQVIAAANLTTDTNGSITGSAENLQEAVDAMALELSYGNRVVVGVNNISNTNQPNSAYDDYATNHFVTVYRIEQNSDGTATAYFRDPGTQYAGSALGSMTIDTNSNTMQGSSPYQPSNTYQLTTVRKNLGGWMHE